MGSTTKTTRQRAHDWRPAFLAAFRNSANVRASAQAAGIDRSTAYRVRKIDEAFAAGWDEAEQEALDLLEAKAMQMALQGDTQILIFLLKARRPDKYRDNSRVEIRLEMAQEVARLAGEAGVAEDEVWAELRDMGIAVPQ